MDFNICILRVVLIVFLYEKVQKEKNNYKNNRGLFRELENRIMGEKKGIMC